MPETATPGRSVVLPGAMRQKVSRDRMAWGAVRTLRLLVFGSIVVPVLLALIGAYFSYRASYQQAIGALAEAVAVAHENTTKILDTHVLVAARIEDALAGLSDADIRAGEARLHERIAEQVRDLPQVAAAWVIDTSGRGLVSARVYPLNRELDHSGRDDFRALRAAGTRTFIWALRARSLESGDFQPYFTVSRRRQASDGRFAGIIVIAVSGDYFASFYNSLLGHSAQYTASVMREDGTSLARYPETPASPFSGDPGELLAGAIADRATGGIAASGSPFAINGSVVAYKRLADYPVYVAIGRTHASIAGEWFEAVAGYAAIGIPAALGFVLLSLLALHHTGREQSALAQANDAMQQRADIETELHRAQEDRMTELSAANQQLQRTIGALEAAKTEAEAASRAKNDFLTNMSHELRTPLNAIIGFSDLMRGELLGPIGHPSYRGYAADIHFSGTHLLDIINSILDVVRHEAGKMELQEDAVAVENVIAEAMRLVGAQAARGEVHLAWHAPEPPLPALYCDRVRLRQMLLNILSNAVKFTGPGGSVKITAELGDGMELIVKDSGIGIAPQDIGRVLTPFEQVASTYARNHDGTGLGLPLTKALIERHGGRLSLDSAPGLGTAVRLWFPAERVRRAPAAAAVVVP
jgi:signal transduction histidine kinase